MALANVRTTRKNLGAMMNSTVIAGVLSTGEIW